MSSENLVDRLQRPLGDPDRPAASGSGARQRQGLFGPFAVAGQPRVGVALRSAPDMVDTSCPPAARRRAPTVARALGM